MNKSLTLITLFAVAMTLTSCNVFKRLGVADDQYVISGEIRVLTPPGVSADEFEDTKNTATTEPIYEITVSYEMEDEAGQMETQMLHRDTFADDAIILTGRLDATQDVAIVVTKDGEDWVSKNVSLEPNTNYKFVIMDTPWGPSLWPRGSLLLSKEETQRFAISGDLNESESLKLETTSIYLFGEMVDEDGTRTPVASGEIILDDGTFSFTYDIKTPVVLTLRMYDYSNVFETITLVAEPSAEYELVELSSGQYVIRTDYDGLHKQLVESWALDPTFVALGEKIKIAREQHWADMKTEQEVKSDEIAAEAVNEIAEEVPNLEFAKNHPAAPECEHVDLEAVMAGIGTEDNDTPDYIRLMDQQRAMQYSALQEILYSTSDPMIAWHTLQLDPFRDNVEGIQSLIAAYESLAIQFDKNFVDKRITPEIEYLTRRLLVRQNDESVIPGQLAPGFTLATFDGEEVSLHGVLQEKEMVLVDFWASWCGPCIASFPALKKMHAAYREMGFEIIGISIDSTMEDWEGGLEDNVLPWVNLGDMKDGEMVGWEAPTATAYGVNFIPKGFLIDSEGCITQKDLPTDKLERVLSGRYGPMPVAEEPTSSEI